MKKLVLAACLLAGAAAFAQPASAAEAVLSASCPQPAQPAPIDGKTATLDQMKAYHSAVNSYIAAVDTYEKCLSDDLDAQKLAAKRANAPDLGTKAFSDQAALDTKNKQAAADAYKGVLADYKAQPKPAQ